MSRTFSYTLGTILLTAAAAAAGPVEWTYSARFHGVSDAPTILLGQDTKWEYDGEAGAIYNVLLPVGDGLTHTGTVMPGVWEEPFAFGHGDWTTSLDLPDDVSERQFVLDLTFTDAAGRVGMITPHVGGITADGVFTTGTGNFSISFEGSQEVTVGGRRAVVAFGHRGSESADRVTFKVDELAPAETPEPGTLILGGFGLAVALAARIRRPLTRTTPHGVAS